MDRWADLSRPPLRAPEVSRNLPWRAVEVVAGTGSTNADVAARAAAGEPEGLVLVADHQTAGRGRRDRAWESPPRAGLAVSVLLRPGLPPASVPPARWSWLSLLAGLAVTDALIGTCGLPAGLKWPNDVLVDGAKVAGLLAEVVPHRPAGRPAGRPAAAPRDPAGPDAAVVLGIGLNVSQRREELPVTTGTPATSLVLAGAAATDRLPVLRAVLRRLADRYAAWTAAAGDPRASGIAAAYRERCLTIGTRVRVDLPDGSTVTGMAEGVDDDGRLLVRGGAGAGGVHALVAGDVVHVRPAGA